MCLYICLCLDMFFFKQKTAYEMRISDWSSDVCSSDLTELITARREDGLWHAHLSDGRHVTARTMVNTAGPWVTDALARLGVNTRARVRLVKGSHIVVPKLYDGDHAYIVQLARSDEHTSDLLSLIRTSYPVFCFKKKNHTIIQLQHNHTTATHT